MESREENALRFEELMKMVTRRGKDELMDFIRNKTDFFVAPASTRFHLSCEGGLLQHSLNVYDCLKLKKDQPIWKAAFEGVSEESIIIMALFHDLCKVNTYAKCYRNQKTYDQERIAEIVRSGGYVKKDNNGPFAWESVQDYQIEDSMPLGHGEKSVIILSNYLVLKNYELYAIRWHMGYAEEMSQYRTLDKAIEKYPIVLALHEADLEASKLMEDVTGNKETFLEG